MGELGHMLLRMHTPSSAVVKAYQTYDFYEHRQPAMQQWADYLTETMGLVIPTTLVIPTAQEMSRTHSRKGKRKGRGLTNESEID